MKKTILIATLALLIAAPANAQTFMVRPCWRPFARLRVFCQVRPCQGDSCAEYVPTTEGNVAVGEYMRTCDGTSCSQRQATNGSENEDQPRGQREPGSSVRTLAAANRIRARYGLPELTLDANLCAECERQANYCASVGALIHGAGVAEILAQNVSGFDFALNQWLASPAHRAILLSGQYRVAGIAVVRDRNGRVWCSMRFR